MQEYTAGSQYDYIDTYTKTKHHTKNSQDIHVVIGHQFVFMNLVQQNSEFVWDQNLIMSHIYPL